MKQSNEMYIDLDPKAREEDGLTPRRRGCVCMGCVCVCVCSSAYYMLKVAV